MIVRGCLRRFLLLILLAILAGLAWLYRDQLRNAWQEARGLRSEPEPPSEALAEVAAARIDSLVAGRLSRVALAEVDVQSLLRYQYAGIMPAFVDSARIELVGDQLRLSGRVPLDRLPSDGALGEVVALLPDTSEITLTGTMLPLGGGRVAIGVNQVSAARIPLPGRIVPAALNRLGRVAEPGLPADAIALRLPTGVSSAYVRSDSLVLIAHTPNR